MKSLLRKLFFWDAPAQGAFFGLTLIPILPKLLLTYGYGIALPLFLRGSDSQRTKVLYSCVVLGAVVIIALLYAILLFILFGCPRLKKPLDKVGTIAICLCAVLMLGFWGLAPDEYEYLWGDFPVALILFLIVYSLYPIVKIHDWLFAVVPLILGGVALFCASTMQSQTLWTSVLMALPQWPTNADHSGWLIWILTVLGILLLALSYLLWGRLIAKLGGLTVRSLFGRGVAMLWIIFAILHLISVVMALDAMRDYRNAKARMVYWEMSVNPQTLEEKYKQSGRLDQAFWDELIRQKVEFSELCQQYDGISSIEGYSNAVLPPEIYGQWKEAFAKSPELLRSEAMLDEPLPLPERDYGFNSDDQFSSVLSKCRAMARLELWRVRFALEAKDILSAQQALQRIDNISDFLQKDYSMLGGFTCLAIESTRVLALEQILGSGLATEQWLHEQDILLQEKENRIPAFQQRMIPGEASRMTNLIDIYLSNTSRSLFLTFPEAWLFLGREGAALARSYCISNFSDFPERPSGVFAGMLSGSMRLTGEKIIPSFIATLRISRGMIAAELARKQTGRYPEVLDDLPIDPFSGKPLKYAVGEVEISEARFQPNENPSPIGITPELQKQLGLTDEQAAEFSRPRKYVFETEWRTVDAVQIWSVGPDGIDNVGLRSTDDIRFVIPIQGKP